MKTNEYIDVSEFFIRHLEGQSIEPPVQIWEQIQQNIPKYSTTSFWKSWWLYNTIAAIIVLSVLVYFIPDKNANTPGQGVSAKHNFTGVNIRNPLFSDKQKQSNVIIEANKPVKTRKHKTEKKVQQAIYYVEVSSVGILEKVEILDSLNNKIKTIQNIVANEYGYYELNIQDLNSGKYSIIFYKKDGKQIVRKEEFR